MYQALLTRRYLTSKIMPLLSLVAVLLSVATILITWSVMGGFLQTLLNSGRTLIGDVAIFWPNTGFAHYEDLIDRLEADPDIEAAAPVIETFGMIHLPNDQVRAVVIKGLEGESFARVTTYEDTLWWRPLDEPTPKDKEGDDPRLHSHDSLQEIYDNGLKLTRPDPLTGEPRPAAVLGIEVSGLNYRTMGGIYLPFRPTRARPDGRVDDIDVFMPRNGDVGLTVIALDDKGQPVDSITRSIPVANEFQTGIYEADSGTILVELGLVQSMLNMDEASIRRKSDPFATVTDPETGELIPAPPVIVDVDPARVTTVIVRARDGMQTEQIRERCQQIYDEFAEAHAGQVPSSIRIASWEDLNRTMIAAVKKETGLVLFIFGVVCFTNVFLVLAIFWSIVNEKTKDVGVLRSLGASTMGVAWIWLRYGMAIGVVGSLLGLGLAWLIVRNINAIHDWMGEHLNLVIWDPRVYYFVEIPNHVETKSAIVVFIAGVIVCLLGALIPATRSARMHPVKALRFE